MGPIISGIQFLIKKNIQKKDKKSIGSLFYFEVFCDLCYFKEKNFG